LSVVTRRLRYGSSHRDRTHPPAGRCRSRRAGGVGPTSMLSLICCWMRLRKAVPRLFMAP